MGAGESKTSNPVTMTALREAGNPLNMYNYPDTHERVFVAPSGTKPDRRTICRCWLSKKFPYCDNAHQVLQKQGINVGPVMLEVRRGPQIAAKAAQTAAEAAPPPVKAGAVAAMTALGGLASVAYNVGGLPM